MAKKMQAYTINKYKQKQMKLTKVKVPKINKDELLVEIKAASLNPVDFKIRDGEIKPIINYKMPLIMGNDFAGVVSQVGKNVTQFKVGDKVYGRADKENIGTFADFIAIKETSLAYMPGNLTFEEASSIPLVGLTSYQALVEEIKLHPAEEVLIHGGAGGVGTFAIQLAKALGAVVTTTASDKGEALVKSLGADHVINYKTEDFSQTDKKYDGVFDTLGGETTLKSIEVTKADRTVVSISAMPTKRTAQDMLLGKGKEILFNLISAKYRKAAKKHQVNYEFLFMRPSGEQLTLIAKYIENGKIKPVIDKVYPFSEANEAMEYLETGRAKGKVVISKMAE